MRKTKVAIVLGAVLSVGGLMVSAQEQTPAQQNQQAPQSASNPAQAELGRGTHHRAHHGMKPEKQLKHLTKMLNLSADQQAQIKPILVEHAQQLKALRADTSLSQQERHAKMRDIREDSKTKLEAVLNDQQKQQFEEILAKRRGHRKGGAAAD